MEKFAEFLNSPVGQFLRDIVEGGVSGAAGAVFALNLDVTTPKGILMAALSGFIAAAIAVARRKLVASQLPPKAAPPAVPAPAYPARPAGVPDNWLYDPITGSYKAP